MKLLSVIDRVRGPGDHPASVAHGHADRRGVEPGDQPMWTSASRTVKIYEGEKNCDGPGGVSERGRPAGHWPTGSGASGLTNRGCFTAKAVTALATTRRG
ncbi:MAG: hypothetical protein MZV70_56675 [Desulfobacterales bacterium]|nr:hypothetical protein [Desulfobacterales bacterium]